MTRTAAFVALTLTAVAAAPALAAPAGAAPSRGVRESRPLILVTDTASNGVVYRIGVTRMTRRGHVVDTCTRLSFTSPRRKRLQVVRRCVGDGSFPYRTPSLAVADDLDPDNSPLVYGIAVGGLGGVRVPLAGDAAPVDAELAAIPPRFGRELYLFSAGGMAEAPLGARAFARDGTLLDGVLFAAQ
jgi:hypothetical protein